MMARSWLVDIRFDLRVYLGHIPLGGFAGALVDRCRCNSGQLASSHVFLCLFHQFLCSNFLKFIFESNSQRRCLRVSPRTSLPFLSSKKPPWRLGPQTVWSFEIDLVFWSCSNLSLPYDFWAFSACWWEVMCSMFQRKSTSASCLFVAQFPASFVLCWCDGTGVELLCPPLLYPSISPVFHRLASLCWFGFSESLICHISRVRSVWSEKLSHPCFACPPIGVAFGSKTCNLSVSLLIW